LSCEWLKLSGPRSISLRSWTQTRSLKRYFWAHETNRLGESELPRPFEVDAAYLAGHLDEMVDSVFEDLESQFLVLPKGPNFVEYTDFQNAYEVLKRRTDAFRAITPDTIWASLQEDGLSFVVLRTILGFSPPEWADLARSDFNVNVPQGTARVLDTRCRHERGYFARLTEGRNRLAIERINGLIAAAVKYI
jgi:hypothetical protein